MKLSRLLLVYFPLLAGLLFVALYFAYHPGGMTLQWLGYRVDMHVGAALFLVALAFLVLQFLGWLLGAILRTPQSFSLARSNARKAKGYRALTRGLTAVAAGDANEARRQAKAAHDLLGEPPLTLLLAAQAAQLAGDETSAERYFDRLTQAPETALLGLRGLTMGALKRGDEALALTYAEKASAVAPQAAWAAETAHSLQVKSGKIEAAAHSLNQLSRAGGMAPKAAQRRRAALLTEQARRLLAEGGDVGRALSLGREAVKLTRDNPGEFVPARLILCRALLRQGKAKEAARLIEQVWDDAPHAALGRAYLEAVGGDTPLDRAQRVQRLVRQNPEHAESHRIAADAALTARLWGEARKHLERLVELEQAGAGQGLSADTCRRMARVEAGENGTGSRGERHWLDMAGEARGSMDWVCETCGTLGAGGPEASGWQLCCPRCDSIDSLAWRATAGAPRQGAALGGIVLDQLPAAETAAPALTPTAPAPQPPPSAPAGPIPHGSTAPGAAVAPGGDAKPGKPAPIGASVDAARLVN
ncbi:MAG TPA: heme biosynthesis HemY N-terminal domain-containing protein [Dongiaceae bacterium]|nr:heme biosynthesis HemY N-terminal domain-containing protein [Dongiaceae bacterium]